MPFVVAYCAKGIVCVCVCVCRTIQFAQVTDYLIDVASTLVSSLQCTDFSLGGVSNPALDRHFQVIEVRAHPHTHTHTHVGGVFNPASDRHFQVIEVCVLAETHKHTRMLAQLQCMPAYPALATSQVGLMHADSNARM